jgi:hypothetical protein
MLQTILDNIFDVVTVCLFIGLVVMHLNRIKTEDAPLWKYLAAAVGCAAVDLISDENYHIVALALLFPLLYFIWFHLVKFQELGKKQS